MAEKLYCNATVYGNSPADPNRKCRRAPTKLEKGCWWCSFHAPSRMEARRNVALEMIEQGCRTRHVAQARAAHDAAVCEGYTARDPHKALARLLAAADAMHRLGKRASKELDAYLAASGGDMITFDLIKQVDAGLADLRAAIANFTTDSPDGQEA